MKSGDILASKYRLVQRIGEGAMGEVWSGENLSTGRKVALKLIIRTAAKNSTHELRQRMLREARACGKLSHRNIVQILDVGETPEGDPFLVLELLRGRTLSERLKDTRRIEPTMAARIGADIATALAVAHGAKIIHRDLKPANIFLHHEEGESDERFVVKVLDFGVSKSIDGTNEGPATVTNMAVGSPVYMSPEQVALHRDLDGRTDIWSLGVVLFEMLTGGRPFTGGVDDVVRQIILTRINKVPAPSTKVRDVSPEFDAIVLRCLENDRARRYADAGEVARGLLAVASAGVPARVSATLTHHIAIEHKATTEATAQDARTPTPTPMPPVRAPSYTRHGTEPMPRPEALIHSANTSGVSAQSTTTRPASWRNEMAAWRAKREADATRNVELAETPGELQTASDAAFLAATNTGVSTGTTSALGALSQSDFGANPFDGSTLRARKRKKNASTLYALLGAGVVVTLLLIGLILTAAGGSDEPVDSAPSQSGSVLVPTSSVHAQRPESPPTPPTIASVSLVTPESARSTALTKPAVNISAPITAPVKQIPVKQSSPPQKSGTKKPAGTTRQKSHDYFRNIQGF